MREKISSMHDDAFVPKVTEHLGEYDNYPERFDPKDKSVLTRLEQFGIDIFSACETLGKKINEFSWEDYEKLVGEAIKSRYDVIISSVFDRYVLPNPENPDQDTRWNKMMELVEKYKEMETSVGLNLIKRKNDFKESGNLVLGLEAGANLITGIDDVKKLIDNNIKLFGFQYNKDNYLATNNTGLTDLGREVAEYLLKSNLIIDLAHAGYKTRKDIMDLAEGVGKGSLIAYTHGSSEEDLMDSWKSKMAERALKQEEIKRLIKMGGIIGLGVSQPFFSSVRKISERINEIAQLENGIDRIAIGTDFGGVPPVFLHDIRNPDDFKKLADSLSTDFNMNDENINKILRQNTKDWLKNAII